MSHIVHIKPRQPAVIEAKSVSFGIRDLEVLKKATSNLGLEFRENKTSFTFPGGKKLACSHTIGIPGRFDNEIGILQKSKDDYQLNWGANGALAAILGAQAQNLVQSYTRQQVLQEIPFGYQATEVRQENGDIVLEFCR